MPKILNPQATLEAAEAKTDRMSELRKNGKSRTREFSPDPRYVAPVKLTDIIDSPFQTRAEPSPASIAKLAESLTRDGQRDPIRVRNTAEGIRYELIAGHRRVRAAETLGWKEISAWIENLDDAQAARQVFDDNEQREDLNQIERALGLKRIWETYQTNGLSMDRMAIDLGIDQSTISNRIRLLAAPESLQRRLISGEISESRLRSLATWAKYGLLGRFEKEIQNRCPEGPIHNDHWNTALWAAVKSVSKATSKGWSDEGPLFNVKQHEDHLEIQEVHIGHNKQERAFNVKLWNQLQNAAKRKKADRETKQAANETKPKTEKTDRNGWKFRNGMQTAWDRALIKAVNLRLKEIIKKVKATDREYLLRLMPFVEEQHKLSEILTLAEKPYQEAAFKLLEKGISEWHELDYDTTVAVAQRFGCFDQFLSTWQPTEDLLNAVTTAELTAICDEIFDDEIKVDPKTMIQNWPKGQVPKMFAKPKKAKS